MTDRRQEMLPPDYPANAGGRLSSPSGEEGNDTNRKRGGRLSSPSGEESNDTNRGDPVRLSSPSGEEGNDTNRTVRGGSVVITLG